MSRVRTSDPPWGDSRSLLVRPDVLLVFAFLAGPITALQVVDANSAAISALALPGYLVFSVFAALVSVSGLDSAIGTSDPAVAALFALNVVWTYLLTLAVVVGVEWFHARLVA